MRVYDTQSYDNSGRFTSGAGVYVASGKIDVVNCSVVGNTSSKSGGGIYVAGAGELALVNSLVANNSAQYGGGIFAYGRSGKSVTITNATITNNKAGTNGSGLFTETADGTIEIRNTIIALNTGKPDVYKKASARVVKAFNTLSSYTNWSSGSSNNLAYSALQPLFADGGDYALAQGSQALDVGDDHFVTFDTDLVGDARIVGAAVDLGAYELQVAGDTPSTVVTTAEDVVDETDGLISLREALAHANAYEVVTFDASLAGRTIVLTSELAINKNVGIDGGDNDITLSGDGKVRVIYFGGGETGDYTLSNLTITQGAYTSGAGIYIASGKARVVNCTVVGNTSSKSGGGIYVAGAGELELVNTLVANNSAQYGGGIFTYGRSGKSVVITNATIANNRATNNGSGLFTETADGTVDFRNSIIALNTGKPDVYKKTSARVVRAFNTLSSYTSWSRGSDNNLAYSSLSPLFTDATSGDYTLAPNSQALNQGSNDYVTVMSDLVGLPRIARGVVDLGAYEQQAIRETPSTIVTTTADVVDAEDGEISLREALAYAQLDETVTFSESLFGQTISLTSELRIEKSVRIDGGSRQISLSGGDAVRVLHFAGATSDEYTLSNLTITQGASSSGAGVYIAKGLVNIVNCSIVCNTATTSGGGVYVAPSGAANIVNSLLAENNAKYGGGLYAYGATGNPVVITNSTVAGNRATTSGSGLFAGAGSGVVEFYNSIIAQNYGANDVGKGSSAHILNAYNTASTFTAWSSATQTLRYLATQALFTDLSAGDYTLAPDSIALDKGNDDYVDTDVDLAGAQRIVGSHVDLGAFERQTALSNALLDEAFAELFDDDLELF